MPDEQQEPPPESYLGDGVYASFDGYHVFLDLRAQGSDRIGLEPAVLSALDEYRAELERWAKRRKAASS